MRVYAPLSGRRILLGLMACVCLGAAGCGKSAVAQFRDSLNPLRQQVQTERSQIAATLQAATLNDPAAAKLLDREIAQLAGTLARMTKVQAPGAAAQHAFYNYNAANRQLVTALYRVAGLVGHGSARQLQGASVAATDAAGAVQRASDALDATLTQ